LSRAGWRRVALAAVLGATGIGALAALGVGPLAPALVDHFADGAKVWRLGRLELDGVSGGSLGDLRIARATLRDEDGIWLEAENLRLAWRPFALLDRRVDVVAARAESIEVLRRPQLSAPGPDNGDFAVRLATVEIGALDLAEGVAGAAASFTFSGALAARGADIGTARLDLARRDGGAERMSLSWTNGETARLDAHLDAPEGSALAALIGAPAEATASGERGNYALAAEIAGAEAAHARLSSSRQGWRLDARADLSAAPALADISSVIGTGATLSASGAPLTDAGAPFTARLESARIAVDVAGALTRGFELARPADANATLDGRVIGLDGGRLELSGRLSAGQDRLAFRGQARALALAQAGVAVSGEGDGHARLDRRGFSFMARLVDLEPSSGPDQAQAMLKGASLSIEGGRPRAGPGFEIDRLEIDGPKLSLSGRGAITGPRPEIGGVWRVKDLSIVLDDWRGAAAGRWQMGGAEGAPWTLDLEGRGENVRADGEVAAQLIGASPTIDARLVLADAILVRSARLSSPRLRAGATGAIRDDIAMLSLEASARGPLKIADARLDGAADWIGRASGPLAALTIAGSARLPTAEIGGLTLSNARVDVTLRPRGAPGAIALDAAIPGGQLVANAQLRVDGETLALDDLIFDYAGIGGSGRALFGPRGAEAAARFAGASPAILGGAAISGRLDASPDGQIDAAAEASGGALAEAGVERLTLSGSGPFEQLAFRGDARGPGLSARARGTLSQEGEALLFRVEGGGAIDGAPFRLVSPASICILRGRIDADADLALGDGRATLRLRDDGRLFAASARLDALPLAPLSRFAGEELSGSADGAMQLSAGPSGVAGEADIRFDDLSLAARAREPIDAVLRATLLNGRLEARGTATSASGLSAALSAEGRVLTTASPLRIARDLQAPFTARWNVSGPAEALWSVFGTLDQAVSGRIEGEGALRLVGDRFGGEGALTLSQGGFEDRITGIRLSGIEAELAFDEAGALLRRFDARDAGGGRVVAKGRIGADETGALEIGLNSVRLLNRPDARARADAALTLTWTGAAARLAGKINIAEATLLPPDLPDADIPLIEVTEINRPPELRARLPAPARSASLPVRLDIAVSAPGRVFTRGRGLDAEWSLDARLGGSLSDPRIVGEANLLRGAFNLAGGRFQLDRGIVRFDGAPLDAEVDISATAEARELTATVNIEGPIATPEVRLSSTPALPEDEILPLLLFGRNAQDLSPLEAAQLAASLANFSGQAAFDIAGAARRAIDLDRLDVRQEEGGILVTGGRYLTRDVYLEVSRGALGATNSAVEWRVRPRLFLISTFNGEGDQRVAVRWRREY
jgi:translocation and assembly module TamB